MKWRNTSERYGLFMMGFHWVMVLLIVTVYCLMQLRGVIFTKGSPGYLEMKHWHYMLGIVVMGLTLIRLVGRFSMRTPRIEPPLKLWQTLLSGIVHWLIYFFMLGMPLLGWLMFSAQGKSVPFFGFELPALIGENDELADSLKELHVAIAYFGYAMIGMHSAAALFHHFFEHDNTLVRMLPIGALHESKGKAHIKKPPRVVTPGWVREPGMANKSLNFNVPRSSVSKLIFPNQR